MGKPSRINYEKPFGNRASSKSSEKKKKSTEDCVFCIGNKQASHCEVTQEFILNHIKKTREYGNDISKSLRTLSKTDTEKWKPKLKISIKTNKAEKKTKE